MEKLRSTLTRLHLIGPVRFVDRSLRRLVFRAVNLLRSLARLPLIGPKVAPAWDRFDPYDRLHFEQSELLRVCRELSDAELTYWIAGGWGLDVLVGCETRRHGDLDFVLDRFHDDLPRVATILTGLGYERKTPLGGTIWFPDAEVYEDPRGHHIEILNINWKLLIAAGELLGSAPSPGPLLGRDRRSAPSLLQRFAATGALDGVSLPALSVTAQQLFHLGYERREEDSHADDVIHLITTAQLEWDSSYRPASAQPSKEAPPQPTTLLLVPIFAFPPRLWRLCRLYHNDLDLMPPHVTLAFPFLPLESVTEEVIQRLSVMFAKTPAFDFELEQIRWFGTNVVYLEPSEADAFRSMIEELQAQFPDFHPYDGEFDSVIPHVTLSEHATLADRRALSRHVPKYVPITARASHVWMMSNERRFDDWSIVKIFPLS